MLTTPPQRPVPSSALLHHRQNQVLAATPAVSRSKIPCVCNRQRGGVAVFPKMFASYTVVCNSRVGYLNESSGYLHSVVLHHQISFAQKSSQAAQDALSHSPPQPSRHGLRPPTRRKETDDEIRTFHSCLKPSHLLMCFRPVSSPHQRRSASRIWQRGPG